MCVHLSIRVILLAVDNSDFNPRGFLAADLRLVWLFDFAFEEMGVLISLALLPAQALLACGQEVF